MLPYLIKPQMKDLQIKETFLFKGSRLLLKKSPFRGYEIARPERYFKGKSESYSPDLM